MKRRKPIKEDGMRVILRALEGPLTEEEGIRLKPLTDEERKLEEEQRRREEKKREGLLFIAEAERIADQERKALPRPSVKDVWIVWKIIPKWKTNPNAIARYLAKVIFDSPENSPQLGEKTRDDFIELGRKCKLHNQSVFRVKKMLNIYLKAGKQKFETCDQLDSEIIKLLVQFKGVTSSWRIISFLPESVTGSISGNFPDNKFPNKLDQRRKRLRRIIPREWF